MKRGSLSPDNLAGTLVVFNGNLGILLDTPRGGPYKNARDQWVRILTYRGIQLASPLAYVGFPLEEEP